MSDRIKVVVVDDHPLFRDGVVHTLQAEPGVEVVGQGASAAEAVQLARSLLPDVILVDVNMPGGGLNAARDIAASCPATKIVMLTVSEEEDDVLAALKAGARAYILKGVPGRELISILRNAHAGEVYVSPALAAAMLVEMAGSSPATRAHPGPLHELTEREREILELIAIGRSNREIGQQLYLTEKTVKHYVTNILQKLQVRNRVEAALMAQKAGLPEHKS